MSCLCDIGCDSSHSLKDGEHESQEISFAGPFNTFFKLSVSVIKYLFLSFFQDRIHVIVLIKDIENFFCVFSSVFLDERCWGFRNVAEEDEE